MVPPTDLHETSEGTALMAKVTGPMLSLGATGTIAKTQTYSKWRGVAYARQRVIPGNPKTTAQTANRLRFAAASAIWKEAPPLLVTPWDVFALGKPLLGRNAFIGSYTRETQGETDRDAMFFSPGARGGLSLADITLTPGAAQITVDFDTPTVPDGWTLQSAIACAITQGDPADGPLAAAVADEDDATQAQVVFDNLLSAQAYVVGGWLRWLKPNGQIAYSASITKAATTT